MKKFISGMVAGVLLASTAAFAVSTYVAEPATFKVFVNGEEFESDPPTMVINGSTYLPLRAIGNALNVPVEWNDELRQVEVGTTTADTETDTAVDFDYVTQSTDNWKMTYEGYKSVSKIDEYTKAPEGKEYLFVFFEVENISSETETFMPVAPYGDFYIDGTKAVQTVMGWSDDYMQMLSTRLEPGKKLKGFFCFAAEPEWSKWEFMYNEDVFGNDKGNSMEFTIVR